MRIDKGFQSVRELAENSVRGRRRVLSIGVANTYASGVADLADFLTPESLTLR